MPLMLRSSFGHKLKIDAGEERWAMSNERKG